jgi:large subunit ribosomal protein L9
MEIILSQEVANLGFKDDVVIVKNGYGRNFLIPKGLGILATDSAKKVLAENLKQRAFKEQKIVDDATKTATALKGLEVKLSAKVADGGHKLFGSITTIDIAANFAKAGQEIEKKYITITGGSVKSLGKYNASVRLHRQVVVDIPFEVVAE